MRKALLTGILCGLVFTVFAQMQFYSTRNYTAVDGLPQSQVRGMVEDKSGYLWMGTEGGGLARFDGREFKVYTTVDGLLANTILDLYQDNFQNLWILHINGITKYDGLHFRKFPLTTATRNYFSGKITAWHDTIFSTSPSGKLTKIYRDSVYYHDIAIRNKRIIGVHQAPAGQLCFFFLDSTMMVKSETASYTMPVDFGKFLNVFNYKDLMVISNESGSYKIDFKNRQTEKLPWHIKNFVLRYDEARDIFWSNSIAQRGLLKETLKDNSFKSDTVLKNVWIAHVFVDSERNTWFGSDGRGLFKYFIQDFDRCPSDKMGGIFSIYKDKLGATWIGTMANGLWKINKGKITSYQDKQAPFRVLIRSIKEAPDGTIWVSSNHGLGKYDRVKDSFKWFLTEDGLPDNGVSCFDFDERGGLFVCTVKGVVHYDGQNFKKLSAHFLTDMNRCQSVYYSRFDQTLYIGAENGLLTIKNNQEKSISLHGISSGIISLNPYRDSLLLCGSGGSGVAILNPHTSKSRLITMADGIASDFIYFVAADEKGYIWIGTEKGIDHLKLNANLEIIENLHYGYDNGLTGVETNQNAFFLSPKEKYFGLVDGIYEFNDLDLKQKKSFDLHLTNVELLYGEYSARAYADSAYSFFKIPYRPIFPTERNHITFHFNKVDKQYPKAVRFKYFLENFDNAWSPPSSMDHVTYGNLPPGYYVFHVMATDNKGRWAKSKIVYSFTILTPFYLRTTFIVGTIILIAGIITLVLYLRVKSRIRKVVEIERIRIKEQEMLRKEIARDFHDEMGNQLTRIINYVSLLKLNGMSGISHEELYTKVETSAKYLYTGTRDFIWAIDPVNDELSRLFIHIRDFGEKLFEEKNISFRAHNGVKEKLKLPYGFSREANLIFKEAMTNAFKYSEAKNVTLSLQQRDEVFELIIEDDGKGFYAGEIEKSNGLINIRERADRLNAVLRISSVKDHGTKIILNFKLTKTLKYGLAL